MDWRFSTFLIALLTILFGFTWATSEAGICSSPSVIAALASDTKDGAFNCFDYWLNRYQTLIGAIVAIGAAWYAGRWVQKQVQLTDEQIKISKEANVIEYRAYVRIDVEKASIGVDKPLFMMVKAVNYGRTPAYDYWAHMELGFHAPGWKWPTKTIASPKGPSTKAVIHSGGSTDIQVDSRIPLAETMIESIRSNELTAYLRITAHYKDAFGFVRDTQVSLEFSGAYCIDNQRPRYSNDGTIFT